MEKPFLRRKLFLPGDSRIVARRAVEEPMTVSEWEAERSITTKRRIRGVVGGGRVKVWL